MKLWSDFFESVIPYVLGCPSITAEVAIKNAVIEFCEKTLILQRDHDPVTVTANIVDYDLEPPTGYLVTKIMKAWYENIPLVPAAPDEIGSVSAYNQLANNADGPGQPRWIFQKDERTFSLLPVPQETSANAVTMRVALKPSRSSTGVEDVVWEDYMETIGAGARSKLLMIPGTIYFNPNMGGINRLQFDQGINVARQRANRGHTRSNLSVRLRKV
jgi:hypothetical protein